MKQVSAEEFYKLLEDKIYYIFNPLCEVAFKAINEDELKVFWKRKGEDEKETSYSDNEFNEAWQFRMMMTKEEYESF